MGHVRLGLFLQIEMFDLIHIVDLTSLELDA